MYVVGLTGGIGCGKSTAAGLFAQFGIPIVDADEVARALVEPGQPALTRIVAQFGEEVLQPDGRLDRSRLRKLVFSDPNKREQLESLLHPLIREEMLRRVSTLTGPYCLFVIPLLIERNWRNLVDRIVVIDCEPEVQRQRTVARDGISLQEVKAIIATQASRSERLAAADEILHNDGNREQLLKQVSALHHHLLELAGAPL